MHLVRFYHKISGSTNMEQFDYKSIIIQLFLKSIDAVNPVKLIKQTLKLHNGNLSVQDNVYNIGSKNFYLIGFGKAVLGMASQCERILGNHLKKGVICVPENITELCGNREEYCLNKNSKIEIYEGARNNLPDEKAEKGCDAAIKLINSLNSNNDNLIILISGGGSALFPKPVDGVSLNDKFKTTALLSTAGATINELNAVRKRISKVKGGGLAILCHPITTITLILSDVINDPLDVIASGPTVPDSDEELFAIDIIKKYKLEDKIPSNVLYTLSNPLNTLKIPIMNNKFPHIDNFIIGNNTIALNASKVFADSNGFKSFIFSNSVGGMIENVADFYNKLLFLILNALQNGVINSDLENLIKECPFEVKSTFVEEITKELKKTNGNNNTTNNNICIISGGEVTVNVQGTGHGGRNQELALIMSKKIHKLKNKFREYNILFLSAGTDGIDGPTDVAGAVGESDIIDKALKMNLSVDKYLSNNDSYNFFCELDNGSNLIKTGHTGTNVMDIQVILIYKKTI